MASKSARMKPYVDALFEVAGSAEAVAALVPALTSVSHAWEQSAELREALLNPAIDRAKKEAVLQAVAQRAGVAALGTRLLTTLLQHHRIAKLHELLAAIGARLDAERNVLEATVRSARPLDDATARHLTRALEAKTRRTVRLVPRVDPELLGGFVVSIGSEVYDASLAHRLDRARAALHAAAKA